MLPRFYILPTSLLCAWRWFNTVWHFLVALALREAFFLLSELPFSCFSAPASHLFVIVYRLWLAFSLHRCLAPLPSVSGFSLSLPSSYTIQFDSSYCLSRPWHFSLLCPSLFMLYGKSSTFRFTCRTLTTSPVFHTSSRLLRNYACYLSFSSQLIWLCMRT